MRIITTGAVLVLLLGAMIAPQVGAHEEQDESTIPGILTAEPTEIEVLSETTPVYLVIDLGGEDMGVGIWSETNDHGGLQTQRTQYEPGTEGCHGAEDSLQDNGLCETPPDFREF